MIIVLINIYIYILLFPWVNWIFKDMLILVKKKYLPTSIFMMELKSSGAHGLPTFSVSARMGTTWAV